MIDAEKSMRKTRRTKQRGGIPFPKKIVGVSAIDEYLNTDLFFELCDDCLSEFFDYFMGCD